jgi:tetratricopeptide (TPR) repeat protein
MVWSTTCVLFFPGQVRSMTKEHTKNKRRSTKDQHDKGQRKKLMGAGGEKGDKQRKRQEQAEQTAKTTRGVRPMANVNSGRQIDELIDNEQWQQARALIEQELRGEPDNHWLLTRLGETYYEQRHYKQALPWLLKSLDIVPDCPLTLWHLAGTLDALGYHAGAVRLYTWLLESRKMAADDPCWESTEWTAALKTDCVFRLGLAFQHLRKKDKAEHCFRQYIDLLLAGAEGSYSAEEAMRHLRELGHGARAAVADELRKTADWVQQTSGAAAKPNELPKLDPKRLRQLQEA